MPEIGASEAATGVPAGERHVGRPLDSSRDDALRLAALTLLAEQGYDRLTIEAIAAQAGASKATIYRRWSNKAELVIDALACKKADFEAPDTGSLAGDLDAFVARISSDELPIDASVVIGLVSALPHDSQMRSVVHERLVEPQLRAMTTVLRRAQGRGEIAAELDLELIVSVVPATILYQILHLGQAPDREFFRRVFYAIVLPAVRNPNPSTPAVPPVK